MLNCHKNNAVHYLYNRPIYLINIVFSSKHTWGYEILQNKAKNAKWDANNTIKIKTQQHKKSVRNILK